MAWSTDKHRYTKVITQGVSFIRKPCQRVGHPIPMPIVLICKAMGICLRFCKHWGERLYPLCRLNISHFIKRKRSKTPEPKQTRQKVRNSVSRPVSWLYSELCHICHDFCWGNWWETMNALCIFHSIYSASSGSPFGAQRLVPPVSQPSVLFSVHSQLWPGILSLILAKGWSNDSDLTAYFWGTFWPWG